MEDPLDTPILDRLRRNGALTGLAQRYVAPVLSQNKVSKNSFKSLPMGLTRTMHESRKLVYGEGASKGKVLERSNKSPIGVASTEGDELMEDKGSVLRGVVKSFAPYPFLTGKEYLGCNDDVETRIDLLA
uniref:Uncharacterized protein n=1 Tax=Tanacetum cinerariifolium TaxID=118510 RepID=A0A6L2KME2_TANCI|nr:hypothetical protein [Tanacetum cinerariifolium]